MKLVIDMNLSPEWAAALAQAGHVATHWSEIGNPRAPDREILIWARNNDRVVFTHDLDFGAILAATAAKAPSVIQLRTQDPTPRHCRRVILDALDQHADALAEGALVTVDVERCRVRLLPLN